VQKTIKIRLAARVRAHEFKFPRERRIKEVKVESRIPPFVAPPAECLTIEGNMIEINIGGTGSFNINSTCDIEREFYIHTDQSVDGLCEKYFQRQNG